MSDTYVKDDSRGSSLVMVLGFLALFVILTSTISSVLEQRSKLTLFQSLRTDALGIAESGLADALNTITATPSWTTGFINKAFGNGTYTVTVDTGPGYDTIVSEGKIAASNFIKFDVTRRIQYFLYATGTQKACATTNDELKIKDNASCIGNAYSGKNIALEGSGKIDGNAEAITTIDITGGSITGTKNSTNNPPAPAALTFPTMTSNATYKANAQAGGTYSGDYKLDGTNASIGPLYITKKLEVKNGAVLTLTGTVYTESHITVDDGKIVGKFTLYSNDRFEAKNASVIGGVGNGPLIISEKEAKLKNTSTATETVLYSYERVKLEDDAAVTGFIIGDKIELKNDTKMTFKEITGLDITVPSNGTGGSSGSTSTTIWSSN